VLDAMPASNAAQLTRLPQKDRIDAHIVSQAVSQKPKEFKATVSAIREKKYGIKPEEWKTIAIRVPISVYDQFAAAQQKVADILQLDISDDEKRATNLITVIEAIAALITTTPRERLFEEIEGNENAERI